MPYQPVYVGQIIVPPSVEMKLRMRRGLTGAEVRATFEYPARPLRAVWHDDPQHGRRLIMTGIRGPDLLKAILTPVDASDGTWVLRTCLKSGRAGSSQGGSA